MKSRLETALCFMALIPPEPLFSEIRAHQQVMSERFGSHRSYFHIPHITVIPPFRVNAAHLDEVKRIMQQEVEKVKPITLKVSNFSHFKKHTIFGQVAPDASLEVLHHRLKSSLNQAPDLLEKPIHYFVNYHPHITVGYRDLEPHFADAWAHFSTQSIEQTASFTEITLLQHDGERWHPVHKATFTADPHLPPPEHL